LRLVKNKNIDGSREFRMSLPGTSALLAAMFASFLVGLTLIVLARTV
jgi:hypothetical protein